MEELFQLHLTIHIIPKINIGVNLMKVLIVFDTVFGNTEKVANEMVEAISSKGHSVEVIKANAIKSEHLDGIELLIVGSPTRAFNPTKDIKNFIKSIPKGSLAGVEVAGFDTRANVKEVNSAVLTFFVRIFGYAAEKITKKLSKKGGKLIAKPDGFFVKDSEGPMAEGEIERAEKWAASLVKS